MPYRTHTVGKLEPCTCLHRVSNGQSHDHKDAVRACTPKPHPQGKHTTNYYTTNYYKDNLEVHVEVVADHGLPQALAAGTTCSPRAGLKRFRSRSSSNRCRRSRRRARPAAASAARIPIVRILPVGIGLYFAICEGRARSLGRKVEATSR